VSSLAILCLLAATEVPAQSCVPAVAFAGVNVNGPKCTGFRCEPGSEVTFTAMIDGSHTFPAPPATCPTEITWNFGDGVTTVTNSETRTQSHVYPAVGRYSAKVTAQVEGAARSDTFEMYIADGFFDLDGPIRFELVEGATANVTVTRTGDLSRPASVDYTTLNYGPLVPVSGTLVFEPGQTSKTVAVQALDDLVWNGDGPRYSQFQLRNPRTYLFRNPARDNDGDFISVYFEVSDNDEPARHRCTQTALTVSETAGFASIEMERTGNLTNPTLGHVNLSSTHLPIPDGVYLAEFPPGQSHATVKLPLTNDGVYLGPQSETLSCGGGGPGTKETASSVKLTILDDEPFPTLIAPASAEIDERDYDRVLEIPLSFVPPFGRSPDVQVTLLHRTTSAADAEVLHPWIITPLSILIYGDTLPEPDETMVVRIAGEVSASIPVTIRDDDRPPFPYAFDHESYLAEEEYARVTIQRSGDRSAAASLILHVRAAMPVQWDDALPVAFAPGEASKDVVIPVQDQWYTGQRTATLELDLDGFVGATAILTINDDEPQPALSIADASVREGGLGQTARLEVPVSLSAPAGHEVKFSVIVGHVTTDDADFRGTAAQTLSIYPGQLSAKAVFEIAGDIDHEIDETFNVTITSCCGGRASVARGTAVATILNDDGVPAENVYRLVPGATKFFESEKWLTLTVKRFGRVRSAALATLRVTAARRHFEPRQVYFAPNETEKEVRFYIDDLVYTGEVDARLELFEGERLLEAATVTILDDERPPTVSVAGGNARENNPEGTVLLRVYVSPPSQEPVTVHLRAHSDTADLLSDFAPYEADVEIPAGAPWRDVPIPIVDDSLREGPERFVVDVVRVSGAAMPFNSDPRYTPYTYCGIDDDESGFVSYERLIQPGTTTTITIELPPGAPAESMVIFPSDARILEMPNRVAVAAGARMVTFEARAHAPGTASFTIFLPSFLDFAAVRGIIGVVAPRTMTISPAALQLEPGASARVEITTSPDLAAWTFLEPRSNDLTVAAVDVNRGEPGEARFLTVYAVAPGRTEIRLTLSASDGGAGVTLPVIVADPVSRRHGVHH
jgi:PKD repeat protein